MLDGGILAASLLGTVQLPQRSVLNVDLSLNMHKLAYNRKHKHGYLMISWGFYFQRKLQFPFAAMAWLDDLLWRLYLLKCPKEDWHARTGNQNHDI